MSEINPMEIGSMKKHIQFTANLQDWSTPRSIYDELDAEFNFTIDVCASAWNSKHQNFWTREEDALRKDWSAHRCFMNPPYAELKTWLKKADEESKKGALVVALIPSRTDTAYWHEHIEGKHEVRFLRGRVRFERQDGERSTAPFPSVVVIFHPFGGTS